MEPPSLITAEPPNAITEIAFSSPSCSSLRSPATSKRPCNSANSSSNPPANTALLLLTTATVSEPSFNKEPGPEEFELASVCVRSLTVIVSPVASNCTRPALLLIDAIVRSSSSAPLISNREAMFCVSSSSVPSFLKPAPIRSQPALVMRVVVPVALVSDRRSSRPELTRSMSCKVTLVKIDKREEGSESELRNLRASAKFGDMRMVPASNVLSPTAFSRTARFATASGSATGAVTPMIFAFAISAIPVPEIRNAFSPMPRSTT